MKISQKTYNKIVGKIMELMQLVVDNLDPGVVSVTIEKKKK